MPHYFRECITIITPWLLPSLLWTGVVVVLWSIVKQVAADIQQK